MQETERFEVQGGDKFMIEAFLTLPIPKNAADKPPLLVMPHGGPIGVFDTQKI